MNINYIKYKKWEVDLGRKRKKRTWRKTKRRNNLKKYKNYRIPFLRSKNGHSFSWNKEIETPPEERYLEKKKKNDLKIKINRKEKQEEDKEEQKEEEEKNIRIKKNKEKNNEDENIK